ncbi:hypothetical protein F8S09_03765 [Deinococcus sp. SDU3-2]|uniref:Uncharacterized protein n=1 Tax=Deinococcus terrestris TaxID=2651870 RepID=A0A7X1TQL2_9DEIO|nr:hypothetical protein [Deinococcus terrestris]MPY65815.1 hypothetical protein [Deinococcus terrestris]
MLSVAEVWLADDLAALGHDPRPSLQADLYRCARETGWTPGHLSNEPQPYVLHGTVDWQERRTGAQVRMRVSGVAPVLGFVPVLPVPYAWESPYLDQPPLTAWWQRAGWLVPDPSWLNATFAAADLRGLPPATARELRQWPNLSRGDALFFEW